MTETTAIKLSRRSTIGAPAPSQDQATLGAAARTHGEQAVAHAATYAAVETGQDAGVDALTHAPLDQTLDARPARRPTAGRSSPTLSTPEGVVTRFAVARHTPRSDPHEHQRTHSSPQRSQKASSGNQRHPTHYETTRTSTEEATHHHNARERPHHAVDANRRALRNHPHRRQRTHSSSRRSRTTAMSMRRCAAVRAASCLARGDPPGAARRRARRLAAPPRGCGDPRPGTGASTALAAITASGRRRPDHVHRRAATALPARYFGLTDRGASRVAAPTWC